MPRENKLLAQIAELEMKVAFQEKALEELNDALVEQQFIIDKMQLQLRHLASKFKGMQSSNVASLAEETPPPHY